MECRRLIKFGRASYVISLPKRWITSNKLNKGDLIFLDETGEKILLSPTITRNSTSKRITISCDKKDFTQIGSEIISAYLNNFDQIKIVGNIVANEIDIKQLLTDLPGLEVIEQGEQSIVAKDLLDRSEITLEPILRRMDMIIRSMLEDARQGVDVFEQDKEVNRLVFLSKRVLRSALEDPSVARSLKCNEISLIKHWTMISYLESVGDEVKRISRLVNKKNKDAQELLGVLMKSYQRLMRSHYSSIMDHARQVELETKHRSHLCDEYLEKNPDNVSFIYHTRALSALLKSIARLLTDFSIQEDITEPSNMMALDKSTGFLQEGA